MDPAGRMPTENHPCFPLEPREGGRESMGSRAAAERRVARGSDCGGAAGAAAKVRAARCTGAAASPPSGGGGRKAKAAEATRQHRGGTSGVALDRPEPIRHRPSSVGQRRIEPGDVVVVGVAADDEGVARLHQERRLGQWPSLREGTQQLGAQH